MALEEPTAKERLAGLALIVVVAVIWIAASFVVQELPLHPFLLTYVCNILFVVYLPISALQGHKRKTQARGPDSERQDDSSGDHSLEVQPLCVEPSPHLAGTSNTSTYQPLFKAPQLNRRTWMLIKAAGAVAPFWFTAQLCFNAALHLTSVTSNTILSSPSSLFTFLLSVAVLKESFRWSKLSGVLLTVLGTILVALADRVVDSSQGEHPHTMSHAVLGDLLTLTAAALYACYTVLIKIMMPDDNEGDMMAFFGYLGAINAVIFSPILLIMQLSGAYNMFAVSKATLSVALLKGLFDNTLADYLWSRAVLLIGPTLATVALQLQVPMAMVVDPLLRVSGWWSSVSASVLELTGAATILSGFFWLNAST